MISVILGFFAAVVKFISEHLKEIIIGLVMIGLFASGVYYEKTIKDKEIMQLEANFKKKEDARTDAINERVKAAELDAKAKGDALDISKADAAKAANKIIAEWNTKQKAKDEAIKRLVEQLAMLNAIGKGNTPEAIKLNEELGQLRLTYQLSPVSVDTINALVKDYAK